MNAITQLHHPLMRKIKEIIGTMYSLRPRSKMFQKKAIINLYAVVEINHCSMPHEAHSAVSLPASAFPPDTPQGPREPPVLSMCCAALSHSSGSNVIPWTTAHQAPLFTGFLARVLEWVAISSSRRFSGLRDQTSASGVSCIGRQVLYHCAPWEAPIKHLYPQKSPAPRLAKTDWHREWQSQLMGVKTYQSELPKTQIWCPLIKSKFLILAHGIPTKSASTYLCNPFHSSFPVLLCPYFTSHTPTILEYFESSEQWFSKEGNFAIHTHTHTHTCTFRNSDDISDCHKQS